MSCHTMSAALPLDARPNSASCFFSYDVSPPACLPACRARRLPQLLPRVVGNVGFIFTNGELGEIRDVIEAHRVPAPARVGSVAPIDVMVPPGPTGCDPGQTSFFQVLQVQQWYIEEAEKRWGIGFLSLCLTIDVACVSFVRRVVDPKEACLFG